jgi:hypothetical protein
MNRVQLAVAANDSESCPAPFASAATPPRMQRSFAITAQVVLVRPRPLGPLRFEGKQHRVVIVRVAPLNIDLSFKQAVHPRDFYWLHFRNARCTTAQL